MDRQQCTKTYISVVEEQSFAAAARARYRSAPQVSKEISWLEDELGVQLITRTTRSLNITDAGQLFYQYAKQQDENYRDIKQQLQNKDTTPQGTLTLTMPTAFGDHVMLPCITEYLKRYPNVILNLKLTNRYLDLIDENIDIAIRTSHPGNNVFHGIEFIAVQRRVFGSKKYFRAHGTPKTPEDLKNHACLLHNEMNNPYRWVFKNNQSVILPPRLLSNSVLNLITAASQDLGVFYLSELQVVYHHVPAIKNLVPVLDEYSLPPHKIYLCYPKQNPLPKKTQAFIDIVLRYTRLHFPSFDAGA